jgi:2'-5' RNA ligase
MSGQTPDFDAIVQRHGISVSGEPPAPPTPDFNTITKKYGLAVSADAPKSAPVDFAGIIQKHGVTVSPEVPEDIKARYLNEAMKTARVPEASGPPGLAGPSDVQLADQYWDEAERQWVKHPIKTAVAMLPKALPAILGPYGEIAGGTVKAATGLVRAGAASRQALSEETVSRPGAPTVGNLRGVASGLSEAVQGVMQAGMPAFGAAALSKPIQTAISLAGGYAAKEAIEKGSNAAGIPQEYSALLGDVAFLFGGAAAIRGIHRLDAAAGDLAARMRVKQELQDQVDAEFKARQEAERAARQPKQLEGQVQAPPAAEPTRPAGPAAPVQEAEFEDLPGGFSATPKAAPTPGAITPEVVEPVSETYKSEPKVGDTYNVGGLTRTVTGVRNGMVRYTVQGEGGNLPGKPMPIAAWQANVVQKAQPTAEREQQPVAEQAPVVHAEPQAEPLQNVQQLPVQQPEVKETKAAEPEALARKFSSTQVALPQQYAKPFKSATEGIAEQDLTDKGRETEPHITVKYGLHAEEEPDDFRDKIIRGEAPLIATIGKTSIFKTPDADVVKLDVESPDLARMNAKIAAAYEHTDTHQTYEPHVTIAYVKPGEGEKYVGKSVPGLTGKQVTFDRLEFSGKDDARVSYPLTGAPVASGQAETAAEGTSQAPQIAESATLAAQNVPPPAAFDEAGWDAKEKAIADRVRQSRQAGTFEHLDEAPWGVEYLRGKTVASLRDGSTGVIRTVDNRGEAQVTWNDERSAVNNGADQKLKPYHGIIPEGDRGEFVLAPQATVLSKYPDLSDRAGAAPATAQAGPIALVGNTYPHRVAIKKAGFMWDKEAKAWTAPDTPENRAKAGQFKSRGITYEAGGWKPEEPKATPAVSQAEPAAPAIVAPTTTPGKAIAESLRKNAGLLDKQIEAKRNPAIAQQNPTARRANIAAGMAQEADSMERVQTVMRNLAQAHEDGTIPPILSKIKNRAALDDLLVNREKFPGPWFHRAWIEDLNKLKGKPGTKAGLDLLNRRNNAADGGARLYGSDEIQAVEALLDRAEKSGVSTAKYARSAIADAKRLYAAGITEQNWNEARAALKVYEKGATSVPPKERQIADLERDLIGRKIEGFFPTPKALVARMVEEAGIEPGMSVLEPSAGNGRLADELVKKTAEVTTVEPVTRLRDILSLKGHAVSESRDFLEHKGEHDRVVMNPPFENGQDVAHVQHAYELLKPGGRIVAIMGEHAFFANDKKSVAFREWLQAHDGTSEKLPEGTFKESGTGVASRLVIVDKPAEQSAAVAKQPWAMTRQEWMAQRPAGTSHAMYDAEIEKALRDHQPVPEHIVAEYEAHKSETGPEAALRKHDIKAPWEMGRDEYAQENWQAELQRFRDRPDILDAKNRDEEIAHFGQLHANAVGQAVREGKPVPPEVLADYPALHKRSAEKGVQSESGQEPQQGTGVTRESEGQAVPEPSRSSDRSRYGAETQVRVPGENRAFAARYAIRESTDVIPSHNAVTLQTNPAYRFRNDRNYTDPRNAERIIKQVAEFDPNYLVTDSPDATNGAPVIDRDGNVLGGNSRTITLERVYSKKPQAAEAYKKLLADKAGQFGLKPDDVRAMDRPVLVRELTRELTPGEAQPIITDLNKAAVAALTTSERAVADSNKMSDGTLDQIAGMIENQGPQGTLSKALEGKGGAFVANLLVKDGVITTQEKPTLFDSSGNLTPVAKDRISKLMLGRVFEDSSQFERTPPALRNKLERIVAPLSRLAGKPEWDLLPDVRKAVDMLEQARASNVRNLRDLVSQQSMFGGGEFSPRVVALANALDSMGPVKLAQAFSRYANDSKGPTMFGEATPGQAFEEAFGERATNAGERGAIAADLATLGLVKFVQNDVIPTARIVASGIRAAKDDLAKWLAPASRGPEAATAALVVRSNAAELARSTDRAEAALNVASAFFDRQTPQHNYDFIDRVENGVAQPAPYLDQIAQTMRGILDSRRDEIRALGTGKLDSFIENYFPHIWKDPQRASAEFANWGKRPMEGSKSFLKKRTLPTFKDGIDAGLEPFSNNPVDLVLAKAREMDKYYMAHRILGELREFGLLKYIPAGKSIPDGYAKIEDRVATVFGPHHGAVSLSDEAKEAGTTPNDVTVHGMRIMGQYVAPEPAARVVNNYLSPGLREKSGAFRAYLGAANMLNQVQLGFSAFHLGFTTVDAATSKLALGIYQAAHGHPMRGAGSALLSLSELIGPVTGAVGLAAKKMGVPAVYDALAPFSSIIRGDRLLREWYDEGTQGAETAALVDATVQAGGRARMDRFYQTRVTQQMMRAFRQANVWGGLIRLPFAITEQAMRPIMEWIVPRQKLGVFADMARFELERLGLDPSEPDAREALARAWDSVDNRMGQLVYDNLFWNKVIKDLAMGSVRSVGWNVGTIREIMGGAADMEGFLRDLPLRGIAAMRRGRPGAYGAGFKPAEFTWRMSYLAALPIMAGLIGAFMYYLWHGRAPEDLKDYYYPRDNHGQRWAAPTYVNDAMKWRNEPGRTAAGKIHPLLTMIWEMLANKDYREKSIYNLHDKPEKILRDILKDAAQTPIPLVVKNAQRAAHKGTEEKVLPFFGVTTAPRAVLEGQREYR